MRHSQGIRQVEARNPEKVFVRGKMHQGSMIGKLASQIQFGFLISKGHSAERLHYRKHLLFSVPRARWSLSHPIEAPQDHDRKNSKNQEQAGIEAEDAKAATVAVGRREYQNQPYDGKKYLYTVPSGRFFSSWRRNAFSLWCPTTFTESSLCIDAGPALSAVHCSSCCRS